MYRSILRRLTAGVAFIAIAAGGSSAIAMSEGAASKAQGDVNATPAPADVNQALDETAKLLAEAIGDKALREQIHGQIAQRVGGVTATDYARLANSTEVHGKLAAAYNRERSVGVARAETAIDRLVSTIPRFQVDVPINFEAWNPVSTTPLVAYVPQGVEDTEVETITAYDSTGRVHELDAQVAPSGPLMVLGIDERATEGELSQADPMAQQDPLVQEGMELASMTSAATCYHTTLQYVKLHENMEPYWKGPAETRLVAKSRGLWYHDEFPYLEFDGDQIWPREYLGCTENDVRFYWYENDSGAHDFTLTCCRGFSFGIKLADEDDLIGGRQLGWASFGGSSLRGTSFGELYMETK